MKILQINAVYPTGSTGKIVLDIHNLLLEGGHESIVCYGRGDLVKETNVYKIAPELIMKMQSLRSKITGYAYAGCNISTTNLINIIKKEKPDVVHLHCINSYIVNIYKLLTYLKTNNINTVLTLHAEFMHTAGCGHALDCEKWKTGCGKCPQAGTGRPSSKIFDRSAEEWKMMESTFYGFDNLVIAPVSEWLYERAKQSPFFLGKQVEVVLNGIDTINVFKPMDTARLRKKYDVADKKIILHVTPNFSSPIKGGKYVIELAKRMLAENVIIFIVGFKGDNKILPSNVVSVEHTKNQTELVEFYSMADLTLLTSVRETFSMVCAESLSCGTPVVGFKAGAPETISLEEYSEFVDFGDMDMLENSINNWINKKESLINALANKARNYYSKQKMATSYTEIYKRMKREFYG